MVTLPSHANILTGLHPYQHGVRENSGFKLSPAVPTLATILARAGYATGAFVGAFPLDSRFGLDRGFTVYDDEYPKGSDLDEFRFAERRGDQVVGRALAWFEAQAGKPRFLWVHLFDPHAPYEPPSPFAARFPGNPYAGEVAATDAFLTPLLVPLLDGGERPALVVFTADHGEALGEHSEMSHGLFAYQATLRVPLAVWAPGLAAGVDARLAGHVYIAPTVLAALGIEPATSLPGRSLLGPPVVPALPLYFEALSASFNRGWAPLRGLVRGGEKAIELPIPELYDLASDPGERRNLAREAPQRFDAAAADLPREETWPPRQRRVEGEEARQLKSLGYLAGSAPRKSAYTAEDDPKNLIAIDRTIHQIVDAYSVGSFAEAERLAREVIAARPDTTVAYEHLALTLRQQERVAEAIDVLRLAVDRGVASPALLRQLGLTLVEAGRPAEAIAVLEPLAAEEDPATFDALAIALSEAGRHEEARVALERALALDPNDARAVETLGTVSLRQRRADEARRHFERAVALNERLPASWNGLGVARSWLGDDRGAIAAWETAVALDARQFHALYNLGVTALRLGDEARARRALERFVAEAPPERYGPDIAEARELLRTLGS